jgi:hypothetical protein
MLFFLVELEIQQSIYLAPMLQYKSECILNQDDNKFKEWVE